MTGSQMRARRRARWWVGGAVTAALLAMGAITMIGVTSSAERSALGSAPVDHSELVDVTGVDVVSYGAGAVTTRCFSYDLPDIGTTWHLLEESSGCATSVIPAGGDLLTQFFVRGIPGEGTAEDLLAEGVARAADAGQPIDHAEVAHIGGRDVAVVTQTTADGLRIATYLVPIVPVAAYQGAPIGVVNIGAPVGTWHDDVVSHIVASLSSGE